MTIAGLIPFTSKPTKEGFRPGISPGMVFDATLCVGEENCEVQVSGSYTENISWSRSVAWTPFIDFRLATKLQFRLALPVQSWVLAESPANADPNTLGDTVIRVLPTASVTVATWGVK